MKEEVEHVKDVAPGLAQVLGSALAQSKEIIDKYVDVGERGSCRFRVAERWQPYERAASRSWAGVSGTNCKGAPPVRSVL
jgi:hypothetical protein